MLKITGLIKFDNTDKPNFTLFLDKNVLPIWPIWPIRPMTYMTYMTYLIVYISIFLIGTNEYIINNTANESTNVINVS
jgi:hypothetical protein